MKKRSILAMVLLMLFTFGIYAIIWYCSFQNEIKRKTNLGYGGFGHLMATIFSFGIYGLVWSWKVGGRLEVLGGKNNKVLYFLLTFFGLTIIAWPIMQSDANSIPEAAAPQA